MANPYMGSGIARGLQSVHQYRQERPEREARLAEAKARQQTAELQLEEYQANQPVREAARSNEIAALEAQTYQTNANLAKQQAYDAFKMYGADSDTRHLNNWLTDAKRNPVASRMFNGMLRVDALQDTPETRQMLNAQGIKDIDGFLGDTSLRNQFVMGTDATGQHRLVDMNKLYMMTGYTQYATDEARKNMMANAQVMGQLRQGGNLTEIRENDAVVGQLAEAMNLPRAEVYKMLREQPGMKAGQGSMIERVAAELRTANPDLSYRDSLTQAVELTSRQSTGKPTNEAAFVEQYMTDNPEASYEDAVTAYREAGRDSRTSTQKDIGFTEEAKEELDKSFGGNFLDADLTGLSTKEQAEVAKYVNRIEQAGGLELSQEEKKAARQFRKLMSVGATAGEELSDEQTGILDSMYRSLKGYISNEVEGKDATVAYESFRAIARNALFGSQVSAADYKAFNNAFASLGKQTGPVLVSLRTQLDMMKEDMQAMADMNDPYVVKARFGTSLDQLDNTIDAIQDRIDIIDAIQKGKPVQGINLPSDQSTGSGIEVNVSDKSDTPPPAGQRKPLSEIFGVSQ